MTLHLVLGESRLQYRFVLVCHVLALGAVWISTLPVWAALAASLGLGIGVMLARRRAARPPLAQLLYRDGGWILVGPCQLVWRGELQSSTWLSRWLTLLHFRLEDGRFLAVPVWRDSLDGDGYRRLQVVLRWCCR